MKYAPLLPAGDFDLVPAVHTAFDAKGQLDLEPVAAQASWLVRNRMRTAFVAGTTGEGLALREEERRALTRAWVAAAEGQDLRIWAHVGGNCVASACALAADAEAAGAHGIAAVMPHFLGPADVEQQLAITAEIAAAAPSLPFFLYDIPALTGIGVSAPAWLAAARERIPNLGGIKYTNPDLAGLQECLRIAGDELVVYYGNDESLIAARALGVRGAVGSTYNFAAPLAWAALRAFDAGKRDEAQRWQLRIVDLVRAIQRYGYLSINKAVMGMLGVPLGPVRLPLPPADAAQVQSLQDDLTALGFFSWLDEAAS